MRNPSLQKIYRLFDHQLFQPVDIPPMCRLVYASDMSPRHPYFDGLLDVGKDFVTAVCDKTPFPKGTFEDVWLVFPERWMNLTEKREFIKNLHRHPECHEINWLSIVTSSIELIAPFRSEQIRDIREIM